MSRLLNVLLIVASISLILTGCGGGGGGGSSGGAAVGTVSSATLASTSTTVSTTPTPVGANLQPPAATPPGVRSSSPPAQPPFDPTQIKQIYGFSSIPSQGAGQTIAIVVAYGSPTIQSDLNTFSSTFNLPTATLQIVYPLGQPGSGDAAWAMETAMDVEWAHAIAPAANLVLVVAPDVTLPSLIACVDAASANAQEVSMSWGIAEFSTESSLDSHFTHSGVSYFACAGDLGGAVTWPAVSPLVTGVGGTSLLLNADGSVTETGWSNGGGGTSSFVAEPGFQSAAQSSGKRTVPDVSYNADPSTGYYVYDSVPSPLGATGWLECGGTSVATPQWAALTALVNATRPAPESGINAAIYPLAAAFNDILSGTAGLNVATTGYDRVTGLGTPRAGTLIPLLVSH